MKILAFTFQSIFIPLKVENCFLPLNNQCNNGIKGYILVLVSDGQFVVLIFF